ncbi:MAG: hypothetical protein KF726_21645 [Anaerolineae bacterium]|nr:hypothetical protein [Anaerolineae bacterium]
MTELIYLIERASLGLYLVCGAVLLLSLRRWLIANGRLRAAEFELEREMARSQQSSALTWGIGMIEVALAVFAITYVVAPTVRSDALSASGVVATSGDQAPETFQTSTPGGSGAEVDDMFATVTAQAMAGSGGPVLLLTPEDSPTPVGTIEPDLGTVEGCDTDQAKLLVPANGQVLFDSVTVIGQATIDSFSSYKFEIAGDSTGGQFAPIGAVGTSPMVQQGILGQVALAGIQPGIYRFRLAVFDSAAALRAFCIVNVRITERPPTITPPGGGGAIPAAPPTPTP